MVALFEKPLPGTVLVSGASGFIGGRLRDALLEAGTDVVSLVRPESPPSKVGRTAAVDYARPDSVREVIAREKPSYVFHVAGATKGVTYADFQRGNVVPTEALLNGLADTQHAVSRFVHVSSLTAYGPSNDGPPKGEHDAPGPVEHYGKSKLEAERAVQRFTGRVPWTILRPSAVFGPAEVDMFTLFKAAKQGVNLFFGNKRKRFSAVYVDDVVRALVQGALSEASRDKGYFLCDGVGYTWEQMQAHIVQAVGRRAYNLNLPSFLVPAAAGVGELLTAFDKKPRLLNRQKALMDAQHAWLCTHEAARRDFGYVPTVFAAEGTRRAYDWYLANGWL